MLGFWGTDGVLGGNVEFWGRMLGFWVECWVFGGIYGVSGWKCRVFGAWMGFLGGNVVFLGGNVGFWGHKIRIWGRTLGFWGPDGVFGWKHWVFEGIKVGFGVERWVLG